MWLVFWHISNLIFSFSLYSCLLRLVGLICSSAESSSSNIRPVGYDAAERGAMQRSQEAKARARYNGDAARGSDGDGTGRLEEGKGLGSDRYSRYTDEEGMFEEAEENDGHEKKYSQARVSFGNSGTSNGPTLSRAVGASSNMATGGSGGGVMVIGASGSAASTGTELWGPKNSDDRDYL